MVSKQSRRQTIIISTFGVLAFVILTTVAITWALGVSYNKQTRAFEQSAVIAIEAKLNNVAVSLDSKLVGTKAPLQLRNLAAGRYNLTVTREGFHPYQRTLQLDFGQVVTITELPLIAISPLVTTLAADAKFTNPVLLSSNLSLDAGELYDGSTFVTRFAQVPSQVHRLPSGYLYQMGGQFHYLLPVANQDVVVYTASINEYLPINTVNSSWAFIVNEGSTKKFVNLTIPSELQADSD